MPDRTAKEAADQADFSRAYKAADNLVALENDPTSTPGVEVATVLVTLTADEAQAILSPNRYMDTVRGGRQRALVERAHTKITTALEVAPPPFDLEEFEREKAAILCWLEQFDPTNHSEPVKAGVEEEAQ